MKRSGRRFPNLLPSVNPFPGDNHKFLIWCGETYASTIRISLLLKIKKNYLGIREIPIVIPTVSVAPSISQSFIES
jgi:hypothetical protein